jgi:hypothetical protein
LTLPKDRNIDYDRIAGLKNYDVKEYVLKDEESFVALYQDFCLDLLDLISEKEPYEVHLEYKQLFQAPGVFDGLINVLVRELRNSPIRPHLCNKESRRRLLSMVVDEIKKMADEKKLILHDFAEIIERIRCI